MIYYKNINDINFENVVELIEEQIRENKFLEYKSWRALPIKNSEKSEFIADFTAFVNSDGGVLIYGIEENNGIPIEIKGIKKENLEREVGRINNLILNNIEPNVPSFLYNIKEIEAEENSYIIVIKINRSWIGPHRSLYDFKFYKRKSDGKYSIDTNELKLSFSLSDNLEEKIYNFKERRVNELFFDGFCPMKLDTNSLMILHLIPLSSFYEKKEYDLSGVENFLHDISWVGGLTKYNIDGLMKYDKQGFYIQFYRKGIIEAVDGFHLKPDGNELVISPIIFEEINEFINKSIYFYKSIGINPPLYLYVTLTGVKEYRLPINRFDGFFDVDNIKVDRNIISLPEIVINQSNYEGRDISLILSNIKRLIYNSGGMDKLYDK